LRKEAKIMIHTAQNLYLEIVGEANEPALKTLFGSSIEAQVLPYARLGDFTLQVSVCSDAIKQLVLKEAKMRLEGLGLTVLGAH
jgi:hypothetical protein